MAQYKIGCFQNVYKIVRYVDNHVVPHLSQVPSHTNFANRVVIGVQIGDR